MTVQRPLLMAVLAASSLGLGLQNRKPTIKVTANPQYGTTPVSDCRDRRSAGRGQ